MTQTQPSATPELRDLLAFALELADEADRIAMSFYRGDLGTTTKADGSLVTLADKAVEARLRELLAGRYPQHAILGEEEGYTAGESIDDGRWILDPIDGTHGFARGLPVWACLVAYERGGEVQVGVASAPALGTRWWAARGLGAYRGATGGGHAGERIHVSSIATVAESHVLNGSMKYALQRWPNAQAVNDAAWRERGYGDFWSHCLVAEGAAEAMYEYGPQAWDLAALQVIVEEAGGRLTDDQGERAIDRGHAVTSNGLVHDELLAVLTAAPSR
ncbi:MAG: histidinol-phosphatase [Dehalococcoidia bacterium]|nr:histidinol-phosphatase [Dehalococcoidia bacterium]